MIVLILIVCFIIYIFYALIVSKLRVVFKYKKYEYTKILSYGMATQYMWHRTDEEALQHYRHFDFVYEIYPTKRRIKPV